MVDSVLYVVMALAIPGCSENIIQSGSTHTLRFAVWKRLGGGRNFRGIVLQHIFQHNLQTDKFA